MLSDEAPSSISPTKERTLMMVAPQLSSALSNIELYEELKASEAKYRTFVERMQDAVYICTPDLRIVDSNQAADLVSAPSKTWTDLKELFIDPEAGKRFESSVRKEGSVQDFEAEFRSSSGETLIGLVSAVADSVRVSVIIRDITEQKKLSHQLVRSQKMESIGTLASGIAHDFNNILGIILPTAELIQLRDTPEKRGPRLEAIVDASRRGAQLTGQLLSMARDEPPSVEPLILNDVVRATEQLLGETLERTVQIRLDLDETLPMIEADSLAQPRVLQSAVDDLAGKLILEGVVLIIVDLIEVSGSPGVLDQLSSSRVLGQSREIHPLGNVLEIYLMMTHAFLLDSISRLYFSLVLVRLPL